MYNCLSICLIYIYIYMACTVNLVLEVKDPKYKYDKNTQAITRWFQHIVMWYFKPIKTN